MMGDALVFNKKSFTLSLLSILVVVGFFYFFNISKRTVYVEVEYEDEESSSAESASGEPNSLSGARCDNYDRRPLAVMIAEDIEARPLSGIASAELVVEMPVVTGSITRMMALFICSDANEVGSVRSARDDFIPLAIGYDAIYAHWGGSRIALEQLGSGIIDNIDALPNPFNAFYRKNGIPMPHDGFTSIERIIETSRRLGYRLASNFEGYKFKAAQAQSAAASNAAGAASNAAGVAEVLEIGYRRPYNVRYEYYPNLNSYFRWRGGDKEIDYLTGEQVSAKNIVVMRAESRPIGEGYNDVDVLGGGGATVFRGGESIDGEWRKKKAEDALRFYNEAGEEIEFVPGQIWIEIVESSTEVIYK